MAAKIIKLDELEDDPYYIKPKVDVSSVEEDCKEGLLNLDLIPTDDPIELQLSVIECRSSDRSLIRKTAAVFEEVEVEYPGIFENCLRSLVEKLQLRKVIDFGSGFSKRMCSITSVVEHVEFKKYRTMCSCGCGIVPFITPFHKHMDAEAVVCINSIQNDHVMWQRLFLQQVKMYKKSLLVVVPVRLGKDEYDPMHVIMTEFPNVEEGFLTPAFSHKYYYFNSNAKDIDSKEEVNISSSGLPVVRVSRRGKIENRIVKSQQISGPEKHVKLRSSVLIAVKDGKVQVVANKDQGCVDFLAAGHVKWGELPAQAMRREWREEMISDPPSFTYIGRVDATVGYAQAYVYSAVVGAMQCIPSRGRVRDLKPDDIIRNDMIPALLMMKHQSLQHVDVVVNYNLMRQVHQSGAGLSKAEKVRIARGRRTVFEMVKTSDRIQVIVQDNVSVGDMITVPTNRWQTQVLSSFALMSEGREIGSAAYVGGQKGKVFLKVTELKDISGHFQPKLFTVEQDFISVQENRTGIAYVQSMLNCSRDEALRLIRLSHLLPKWGLGSDTRRDVNGQDAIGLGGANHKGDGPFINSIEYKRYRECFVEDIKSCKWSDVARPGWSWCLRTWFYVTKEWIGTDQQIIGPTLEWFDLCFGRVILSGGIDMNMEQ